MLRALLNCQATQIEDAGRSALGEGHPAGHTGYVRGRRRHGHGRCERGIAEIVRGYEVGVEEGHRRSHLKGLEGVGADEKGLDGLTVGGDSVADGHARN